MVKTKNKKRVSSDVLTIKKANTKAKKNNPFEVHTNKEKFSVMGRQLKHDKGMPGVSRAKAIKRRKDTLGQEYLHQNKTNSFKDKRIGEYTMTKEEAASARFVAERLNQTKNKKQQLFNLNDDDADLLTHKGQTLEEIEQFGDTLSDEEDDNDEEIGKLDAQYTGAAHFGGGDVDDGGEHGRKSAIDDLIADQKRRKKELTREKEEVAELTHRLDDNWRSLIPLMAKMSKEDEVKPKPDDYDRALREMIFEPRGAVTDKLKSEVEIVKVEKEKLEKLERDRLERMRGETEEEKRAKHRSADDLDDGYFLQPSAAVEKPTLAYDINGKSKEEEDDDDDSDEDLFSAGTKNGLKENEDDDDDEDENTDEDVDGKEQDQNADEDESDEKSADEESSSDDEDNLSDLKCESSEDESEPEKNLPKKRKLEAAAPATAAAAKSETTDAERRKMMEKANAELPYTFDMPDSYEDLEHILKNRNAEYQCVILERMLKCNHPKISPENKPRMVTLFAYLLQHINDTFETVTAANVQARFRILDRLCPFLYDLSQLNPAETTQCFKEVIKEKQADYRGHIKRYPTLDTLVFLKLASDLYSTSDFRHHIVTPCYIFLGEILTRCRLNLRSDIASGLFLCTVAIEYAQLSRRFLPAVMNYLAGVLFLCIPKRPVELLRVVPPFRTVGEQNSLLVLAEDSTPTTGDNEFLKSIDLIADDFNDSVKVRILNATLMMVADMLALVADHVGAQYLCHPFAQYLDKLDGSLERYPQFVRENVQNCLTIIEQIDAKPLQYIVAAEKKPKALRMLEPKFEKVYDDKRCRRPGNKDKIVEQGMIRKIKSETRGAIREIRRDNAFLSKIQLKKQLQSDAERKDKVKRIFSEASIQQGELNALDRKKKHM